MVKMLANINSEDLKAQFRDWVKTIESSFVIKICYAIFCGFVLASLTGTVFMTIFLKSPQIKIERSGNKKGFIKLSSDVDFHGMKKAIIERNLFNANGKVPDEADDEIYVDEKSSFDIKAPCSASSLKLELVGTIYGGENGVSVATVREGGINFADVYKVGDEIIDSPGAVLIKIEPKQIIINNNGKKECIKAKETGKTFGSSEDISDEDAFAAELKNNNQAQSSSSDSTSSTVILDAAYVEKELGPGFTQIMQTVRVVPNVVDGTMNGFKVFGIKPGSLFSKIFNEGDVVTQVNDSNLSQPEQGFSVYQAFLDSQDIRINILRGSEKITKNVQIK